jgi:3-oxoadipate enol-lactonase
MLMTTGRGQVSVHAYGSGRRPVLLLHPLALSAQLWQPVADDFPDDWAVQAMDARGHGDAPWDGRPFSMTDLADDAAEMIRAADPGPVDVIGMSMGGSTAVLLAARHPELVRGLVLADATACYGPDRVARWRERADRAGTLARAQQVPFQLDRWFSESFRTRSPAVVDHVVKVFLDTDSAAHAAACLAMGDLDATASLPSIRARTLVLVGADDYATPPAMARELAAGIPDATLWEVPARHLSLVERPDLWVRIGAYLDDHPTGAGDG